MVEKGALALEDAFSSVLGQRLLNVYNFKSQKVEEFDPSRVDEYSQGQCALAIERVFKGIYQYLQFKQRSD